ncbi:ribonuclease H-like domain-containing protein [Chytridium lagenaria]|nr:ribonuclease H-like domain-containing protein [Chytridium lagenaria]
MHINRHNFESSFPLIKASIESADFISIDTELSGLHSDRAHGPDLTDTLSHRYTNTRRSARDFSLVQYGLCTFTKASSTTFTCRPFNFPLFPASTVVLGSGSEESRAQPTSKTFMVQPSAFEFWQRIDLILQRIPYLNLTDEAVMREKEGKGHHVKTTIAVNEKSIGFLKKIINKVDKWVMESVGEKCAFVRVSEDNKQRVISEVKKRRLSDEENVELDVIDHMKGFTRIMEILVFPEGFEGYQQTGSSLEAKFHEAGYDAFVTGCCFARMVKYIVEDSGDSGEEWFESEVVTRFRNKLYLMRSGTAFLDLEKDEEPQDPSYTFFLHNLPVIGPPQFFTAISSPARSHSSLYVASAIRLFSCTCRLKWKRLKR